jgi:hypothetical protein
MKRTSPYLLAVAGIVAASALSVCAAEEEGRSAGENRATYGPGAYDWVEGEYDLYDQYSFGEPQDRQSRQAEDDAGYPEELQEWGYGGSFRYGAEDQDAEGYEFDYDWDYGYYEENYYTEDWFELEDAFSDWYDND